MTYQHVAVLPVIWHASFSENGFNQIWKPCFGSNIIRQDHHATLPSFEAHHSVGGLTIVATLKEAVSFRAVEHYDAQTGMQVFPLLRQWGVGGKDWKLMSSADIQLTLRHLGSRGFTEAIASNESRSEFSKIANRCVHRSRHPYLAAIIMFLRLASIVPSVCQVGCEIITPHKACALHAETAENGLSKITDINAQSLRLAAMLDDELQQNQSFPE